MFDLAGKIAVVTGGSRGIGRATSLALAEAGAHVLVNYRSNEEAAKETLALIEKAGGQGELLGFDVADPEWTVESKTRSSGTGTSTSS